MKEKRLFNATNLKSNPKIWLVFILKISFSQLQNIIQVIYFAIIIYQGCRWLHEPRLFQSETQPGFFRRPDPKFGDKACGKT